MSAIGLELSVDQLVLTRGRAFRWNFQNLDESGEPENFPEGGDLFFELQTGIGTNAQQEVRVTAANGGTYNLVFSGQTTANIDYYDVVENPHAIDGDITTALEALSNIGAGNVICHPANLIPVWEIHLTTVAAVNAIQQVLVTNADGGTFTLRFAGYTSAAIAFDATAEAVETALEALTSIGSGNVAVTAVTGGYSIEFIGTLADTNVQKLYADASSLTATTGTPSVTVTVTRPGDGALSDTTVENLNQAVNDFFNTFDSLLGVDIDLEVLTGTTATIKVSSLKTFDEVSLITFAVAVTPAAIEDYLANVLPLVGVADTVTVDFYWDYKFRVEFLNELGRMPQPAMTAVTTNLTGLNNEQDVVITVLELGSDTLTVWHFDIVDDVATLSVDSTEADQISPRTSWQLVFQTAEDTSGGDPIARGKVSVQE